MVTVESAAGESLSGTGGSTRRRAPHSPWAADEASYLVAWLILGLVTNHDRSERLGELGLPKGLGQSGEFGA